MKRINRIWVASLDGECIVAGTNKRLTRKRARDIYNDSAAQPTILADFEIEEVPLMIGGHIWGANDAK